MQTINHYLQWEIPMKKQKRLSDQALIMFEG